MGKKRLKQINRKKEHNVFFTNRKDILRKNRKKYWIEDYKENSINIEGQHLLKIYITRIQLEDSLCVQGYGSRASDKDQGFEQRVNLSEKGNKSSVSKLF